MFGCKDKEESTLSIDKTTVTATGEAGEYSVKVISNTSWTARSETDWCAITPAEGNGNGEVKIKLTGNPSTQKRTTNVLITGEGAGGKTIAITQEGLIPRLSVDKTTIAADKKAGKYTVKVTGNVSWRAFCPQAWCSPLPEGQGDGTLIIDVLADNDTDAERTTVVTLTAYGDGVDLKPVTITVTQTARTLTGIAVTKQPTQTVYDKGTLTTVTDINIQGMVVTGAYDAGAPAPVTVTSAQLSTTDDLTTGGEKTITITVGEKTATFKITVKSVESIAITTQPKKTVYDVGELTSVAKFDLTGMVVTATYNAGNPAPVTINADNLSATDNLATGGEKTITVTVDGKTATFKIKVRVLTNITITKQPTKIIYDVDELKTVADIKLDGLIVSGTYDTGDKKNVTVTAAHLSTTGNLATGGEKTITITIDGQTATFKISVRVLQSIAITTPPKKLAYKVDALTSVNNIDLTGLVVTGTYDIGNPAVVNITAANLSTSDNLSTIGNKAITITVNGKSTLFNITVTYSVCWLGNLSESYASLEEAIDVAKGRGGNQTITLLMDVYLIPQTINVTGLVLTITSNSQREIRLASTGSIFTVGGSEYSSRNAKLVLDGDVLLRGIATSEYGGSDASNNTDALVTVQYGGELELKGNTVITGNANVGGYSRMGGGVYAISGSSSSSISRVTISGNAKITKNTAKSLGKYSYGGGIQLENGSILNMEGGEISGNTAAVGGGVSVLGAKSKFYMKGGVIKENLLKYIHFPQGGGVCVDGTFVMSGSALIPSPSNGTIEYQTDDRNTVYLTSTTLSVLIDASLTASNPVATIDLPRVWFDEAIAQGLNLPVLKKYNTDGTSSIYTGNAPTNKFTLGKYFNKLFMWDITQTWKTDGTLQ